MLQQARRRPILVVVGGGMTREEEQALLHAALDGGSRRKMDALVQHVLPAVHRSVARALGRQPAASSTSAVRHQLEDLIQECFAVLFARKARTLRSWTPEGGMSLKNFCAMVAARRTSTMLKADRRLELVAEEEGQHASRPSQHAELEAIDLWNKAYTSVRSELSDSGRVLLDLFFVEDATLEQITAQTGLNSAAVYQRRSRLRSKLRIRLDELGGWP